MRNLSFSDSLAERITDAVEVALNEARFYPAQRAAVRDAIAKELRKEDAERAPAKEERSE